jgi:hypothetical protein
MERVCPEEGGARAVILFFVSSVIADSSTVTVTGTVTVTDIFIMAWQDPSKKCY